jgi:Ca-activated chloride channel homolog
MRLTIVCFLSSLSLLSHTPLLRENAIQFEPQQTDLRTLIVTVTDKNHAPIPKLDTASFTVTTNKISQEVVDVSQTDSPLSVAIVFDLSSSTGTNQGRASKLTREALDAIKSFVGLGHPANEYFIVGFHDKAQALSDRFQNAEVTVSNLNAMGSLTFKGGSAIYDAIHLAVDTLSTGKHAKRAILLVSDGQDSKSQTTFKQTALLLQKTDILIYPINIASDEWAGSALAEEGKSILEEFASLSGGRYVQPKQNNLALRALLNQVAVELRGQYLVRFRRAASLKNDCDELKVKVTSVEGKTLNSRVRKKVCDS